MSISVQRKRRGIMPGILLYCFYIISRPESVHDICMSQIMESVFFKSCIRQLFLQYTANRPLLKVASVRFCKHQIGKTFVIPCRSDCQTMSCLSLFMLLQQFHHKRSRRQCSSFSVLRSPKGITCSFFTRLAKLLRYADDPVFEIDTVPGQSDQFAGTHSGKNGSGIVPRPGGWSHCPLQFETDS